MIECGAPAECNMVQFKGITFRHGYAACAVRALLDAKDVVVHNPTVLDVDLGEVGCNADCSQV